jgi:hypothetical protein
VERPQVISPAHPERWDLETWEFSIPTMGHFKYPVPPFKNKDPETWPSAQELTDEQLRERLQKVERRDCDARLKYNRQEHPIDERQRWGLNHMYADLHREAVARDLGEGNTLRMAT